MSIETNPAWIGEKISSRFIDSRGKERPYNFMREACACKIFWGAGIIGVGDAFEDFHIRIEECPLITEGHPPGSKAETFMSIPEARTLARLIIEYCDRVEGGDA